MFRRWKRWILLAGCLAVWCWGGWHIAEAHANLLRSSPQANATLQQSPDEIRLWFSEPLEPAYSRITLHNSIGTVMATPPSSVDADDPTQMVVHPGSLASGLYTVVWHAVSQADGHRTEGNFAFGVGIAVVNQSTEVFVDESVPIDSVVIRWFNLLSLSLVVGGIAFDLFVWQPVTQRPSSRLRILAWIGWLALGGATVLVLLMQASAALDVPVTHVRPDAELVRYVQRSQFGPLWLLRSGLWLLLGLMLWFRPRWGRLAPGALLVGAVVLVTQSLSGHARAAPDTTVAVVGDGLHVWAATVWIGGLIAFLLVLLPARQAWLDVRTVSRCVGYFSNYARISVALLAITGLYAAWLHVGSLSALAFTVYGRALLVKLVLFLALLAVAGVNLLLTARQLRNGNAVWVGILRRLVGSEMALTMGALAAAAIMTAGAPARDVQALRDAGPPAPLQVNPYFEMKLIDGMMIHLQITPDTVGPNDFSVSLFSEDGSEVIDDASLIRLRFDHREQNLGESELRPQFQGEGLYTASGTNLSIPGPWRVRMTIQRPDQFDTVVDFDVKAAPPPDTSQPIIDATLPPIQRAASALLCGVGLLVTGGYFLLPFRWAPLGGREVLALTALGGGLVMFVAAVLVAV
jgi:copper transport protein